MFYRVLRENDCDSRILCWAKSAFGVKTTERFSGATKARHQTAICVRCLSLLPQTTEVKESRSLNRSIIALESKMWYPVEPEAIRNLSEMEGRQDAVDRGNQRTKYRQENITVRGRESLGVSVRQSDRSGEQERNLLGWLVWGFMWSKKMMTSSLSPPVASRQK